MSQSISPYDRLIPVVCRSICTFQFIQQDLIIRGGQNVYPAEVEYFLHTHPKIQDAQVKRIIEAGVGKAYCKIS